MKQVLFCILVCIAIFALAGSLHAFPYQTEQTAAVGNGPSGRLNTGDFNEDGSIDIVTGNQFIGTISLLLGDGTGSFAPHTTFSPVGTQPSGGDVGDIDGDMHLDFIVASQGTGNVDVFLGDGAGVLTATTSAITNKVMQTPVLAFVDGDTNLDIVTGTVVSPAQVFVLLGDGSGGFATSSIVNTTGNPFTVAVGDFNSDTNADVVSSNNGAGNTTFSLFLGDGAGNLGAETTFEVGGQTYGMLAIDLNGDGDDDVIAGRSTDNTITVFLGDGAGGFSASSTFATSLLFPAIMDSGDVDLDGNIDVAVAGASSNNVEVFFGDGAGSFSTSTVLTVGTTPFSAHLADLDNDNSLDVLANNFSSDTVSYYVGVNNITFTTPTTTPQLAENGSATSSFSIVLDSSPGGQVDITFTNTQVSTGDSGVCFVPRGGIASSTGVFAPCVEWDTLQAFTLSAADDAIVEGTHMGTTTFAASSSDAGYNSFSLPTISSTITDNDTANTTATVVSAAPRRGGGKIDRTIKAFSTPTDTSEPEEQPGENISETSVTTTKSCPPHITEDIIFGEENNSDEVQKLQEFFNEYQGESLVITGIYDDATFTAVKRYQEKYADVILAPWGLSTGTGYVYKTTRGHINSFYCNYEKHCPYFDMYTDYGDTGDEVLKIQSFLKNQEYYADGLNGIFDYATQDAIQAFQSEFHHVVLTPWGLSTPTGFWYKTTRKQANRLVGCVEPPVFLEGVGAYY